MVLWEYKIVILCDVICREAITFFAHYYKTL